MSRAAAAAAKAKLILTAPSRARRGGAADTELASSLSDAVERLQSRTAASSSHSGSASLNDHAFLIGGAQLYNAALQEAVDDGPRQGAATAAPYSIDRILLTRLFTEYPDCDTFLRDFAADQTADGRPVWRRAEQSELQEWAGWQVPAGRQSERDKAAKGAEAKMVEYEYQMWVRRDPRQ